MKRKKLTIFMVCGLFAVFTGCKSSTTSQTSIAKDAIVQSEMSDTDIQDVKSGIAYPKVSQDGKAIIDEEYQKQLREKYASYRVIEAVQDDDDYYLYNDEIIPSEDTVWEDTDFSPEWQASAIELSNGYILSHELFNTDICNFISELSAAATLKKVSGTDSPKASISEGDLLSPADVKELVRDCKAFQSVNFLFYDKNHNNKIEIQIFPCSILDRHEKRILSIDFESGAPNYIICESKQVKIASNPIDLFATEIFAYYEDDPEVLYYG